MSEPTKRLYPSARVRQSSRGLVHCVAQCSVCEWSDDRQLKAARAATAHVRETGHKVLVEQGIVYSVSIRDRGPR